jgi:glycosyltransferase involved in cell wall biosynthesis
MKILNMSYAYVGSFSDPEAWLARISFFTGLLEGMAHHAEVVAVYNIHFKGDLQRNGVTYLFPGFKAFALRWPFGFNKYILSHRPDVVIIQGFSPWQTMLLGKKNPGLKILVQHRAEKPFKGLKKILQKQADRYIHSYFFSSLELANAWIDDDQIGSRSKVIETMGMSSPFKPIEKKLAFAKMGVNSGCVFLWVGDLDSNKNPLLAIEAFAEFVRNYPSALLLMIYQTTGLEATMRMQIRGLEANIRLIGKVPYEDMINWYASADFILSTSYYESAGQSVCEGMSCGCIPIVTDIPSFRKMTDQGRVGLLFKAGSKESLGTALEECISLDRMEKRKDVLTYFETKLSFDANVKCIMEVANSLK